MSTQVKGKKGGKAKRKKSSNGGVPKKQKKNTKKTKAGKKTKGVKYFADKPMSSKTSGLFFSWLIAPISVDAFHENYFEKKPLIIHRNPEGKISAREKKNFGIIDATQLHPGSGHYYSGWFGRKEMDSALQNEVVTNGKDIDITTYSKSGGKRVTVEHSGRASAEQVWKNADDGCSIRFLCPQRFNRNMWRMINLFEDFTGMGAGANTYWTPAMTQGFAPHYDEVDIFVLQTEGSKRWRLYPARDSSEILPQYSSRNFEQHEIGAPYVDVVLREGDFLYAPRGTIHQCVALEEPSLHITLSSCLRVTWADYMKQMLPFAIDTMFEENLEFRKVLPRNFHRHMGIMYMQGDEEEEEGNNPDRDLEREEKRSEFQDKFLQLMTALVNPDLPHDTAVDNMALDFMHGRVPPALPESNVEMKVSSKSRVRLVQAGVARLVSQAGDEAEEKVSLFYTAQNSRLFKGNELGVKKYPITYAPALEELLLSYPKPLKVKLLPFPGTETDEPPEDDEEMEMDALFFERQRERQITVCQDLVDTGILCIVPKKKDASE